MSSYILCKMENKFIPFGGTDPIDGWKVLGPKAFSACCLACPIEGQRICDELNNQQTAREIAEDERDELRFKLSELTK